MRDVRPLLAKYGVTAYIAGHDHCMETLVDGAVDHHGMGSAHENDDSTKNQKSVPEGSLKFHVIFDAKRGDIGISNEQVLVNLTETRRIGPHLWRTNPFRDKLFGGL